MCLFCIQRFEMFRLTASVSSLTRFLDQGVDLSGYHVPANVSSRSSVLIQGGEMLL